MSMSSDTCTTPTAAGMLAFGPGTAPDLPAGGLALSRARRMMSGRTARRLAALVTIRVPPGRPRARLDRAPGARHAVRPA